jgi:hypothetical protein
VHLNFTASGVDAEIERLRVRHVPCPSADCTENGSFFFSVKRQKKTRLSASALPRPAVATAIRGRCA